MADINLLPDDFRQREQKELKKASRISKDARIEFSGGQKSRSANKDQDSPSFWTRLFGVGGKKQVTTTRHSTSVAQSESMPKASPVTASSAHTGTKPVYQPRTTRWADILGTGVVKPNASSSQSVIKNSHHKATKIHQPIVENNRHSTEDSRPHHSQKNSSDTQRMGWWQIIRSIFVSAHRVEPVPAVSHSAHVQDKHSVTPPKERHHTRTSETKEKDRGLHDAPKTNKLLIDVNLIPQELLLKKHWSPQMQIIFVVLAVIVPALLVAGVYFGIGQLQRATDRNITFERQRMEQITSAVATLHKRQATDRYLERKLVAIDNLMKHHIRWSGFFAKLEKYTLDGVYYTDIKADISGELVLPAVAPNYEVAAQQLVALREATDFIADAQVNAMQVLTDSKKGVVGVSFNLKIVLKDDVLLAP